MSKNKPISLTLWFGIIATVLTITALIIFNAKLPHPTEIPTPSPTPIIHIR